MSTKCTSCVSEFIDAKAKRQVDEGREYTEDELYEPAELWARVRDADTWLKSWEEKYIGNTVIVAAVALPVCMKHIGIRKPELQEIANRSGLALPG